MNGHKDRDGASLGSATARPSTGEDMMALLHQAMSVVEYVYVTDAIRPYPLGFCTQEEAVVAGVNLFTRQQFDGPGPFRHAFGIHRSDCERVEGSRNTSIQCDADEDDGYCWEGFVEASAVG